MNYDCISKTVAAVLVVAGISGIFANTSRVIAAGNAQAFLATAGTQIRTDHGRGRLVLLRGVNLGGFLLFEPWMCPMNSSGLKDDYSARRVLRRRFGRKIEQRLLADYENTWIQKSDFKTIASLGLNTIRLPFWYMNLQRHDGTWRKQPFRQLDRVVKQAWAHGIYTILDMHGVPGGQSNSDDTGRVRQHPRFFTTSADIQRTVAMWHRIAEHFRGDPAVAGYDLLNEPMAAPSRPALWAVYRRLYQAVRSADPAHIIFIEGCWGGHVNGKYMGWGWNVLPNPKKFGWTNVAYEMHSYNWNRNSTPDQINNIDTQVRDFENHKSWNVPCYIGEFNVMAPRPDPGRVWAYAIRSFNAHDMSWTMWSYKAALGTGNDGWGLFNPRSPEPPVPNLRTDSAKTIQRDWEQWGTVQSFAINPMLKTALTVR